MPTPPDTPMTAVALVTNALEFAGPPAVAALLAAGFRLVVHDPAFVDAVQRTQYASANADLTVLAEQQPDDILKATLAQAGRLDVLVSNDAFPAIHGPIAAAAVEDLHATLERLVVFPFALARGDPGPARGTGGAGGDDHVEPHAPADVRRGDLGRGARGAERTGEVTEPRTCARRHPGQRHRAELPVQRDLLPARASSMIQPVATGSRRPCRPAGSAGPRRSANWCACSRC